MKKENIVASYVGDGNGRITRARAAALCSTGQLSPIKEAPMEQDPKWGLRANKKRAPLGDNNSNVPDKLCVHRKRRAVLQDVTNVCCGNSYRSCFNATKFQAKNSKQVKKDQISKVVPSVFFDIPQIQADSETNYPEETVIIRPKSEDVTHLDSTNLKEYAPLWLSTIRELVTDDQQLVDQSFGMPSQPQNPMRKAENGRLSGNSATSSNADFTDIDLDHKDPQLCSLYASNIYSNMRLAELVRRPYPNFMETVQRDITQSMRGILVDWLVEVSEEYKLVPDTLYLTVYLIDWFLSHNYVERQRLQLLGITCMLIASKYEEICAPRVEEFCFITDNTYTREEVLKMESQVLKYFGFQLFAPTAKTFLRRFLRAAQASYKSRCLELEYLANYLAELTLVDYNFLNFPPSTIAASAVFLARWTLDQSSNPWNTTLEHYSSYKASDLKSTVSALQDLQLNTAGCPLNAIRMKYKQQKFKSVAALSSTKLLDTVF
ncbi:Cyclin_N domain-containing protein/Cyclin_C domain-containing protein [Cephalotus follicularis]|uniref:B-like cyclin n=1 Tax=Cephalotus follicularis TaxID=3775 RepID=A0A1Q3AZA9_CEPFO|nr:Cyclin_N domain-containing protein/Cyclin_C domain-containing protein [Cephalotus follicularis]